MRRKTKQISVISGSLPSLRLPLSSLLLLSPRSTSFRLHLVLVFLAEFSVSLSCPPKRSLMLLVLLLLFFFRFLFIYILPHQLFHPRFRSLPFLFLLFFVSLFCFSEASHLPVGSCSRQFDNIRRIYHDIFESVMDGNKEADKDKWTRNDQPFGHAPSHILTKEYYLSSELARLADMVLRRERSKEWKAGKNTDCKGRVLERVITLGVWQRLRGRRSKKRFADLLLFSSFPLCDYSTPACCLASLSLCLRPPPAPPISLCSVFFSLKPAASFPFFFFFSLPSSSSSFSPSFCLFYIDSCLMLSYLSLVLSFFWFLSFSFSRAFQEKETTLIIATPLFLVLHFHSFSCLFFLHNNVDKNNETFFFVSFSCSYSSYCPLLPSLFPFLHCFLFLSLSKYVEVLFLCRFRFDTSKKKLEHLSLQDWLVMAGMIRKEWQTVAGIDELDSEFLQQV